jgi:hypothetical protein
MVGTFLGSVIAAKANGTGGAAATDYGNAMVYGYSPILNRHDYVDDGHFC